MRKVAAAPLAAGALAVVPPARPQPYLPRVGAGLAVGGVVALGIAVIFFGSVLLGVAGPLVVVLAVLMTFFGLLILIGSVLSWIGQRADQLPLLARIVVRNSDRHRSRSWLVVGAFLLVIGFPVAIGAAMEGYPDSFGNNSTTQDEQAFYLQTRAPWRGSYLPASTEDWSTDEVAAFEQATGLTIAQLEASALQVRQFSDGFTTRVQEVVGPVTQVPLVALDSVEVRNTRSDRGFVSSAGGRVAVATPELLSFLGLDEQVDAALVAGRAIVFEDPGTQRDIEFASWSYRWSANGVPQPPTGGKFFTAEVLYVEGVKRLPGEPIRAIVSAGLAEEIGAIEQVGTLYRASAPLTDADTEALFALADELWQLTYRQTDTTPVSFDGLGLSADHYRSTGPSAGVLRLILTAIAIGVAALIALMTSALSAIETDGELEALIAAGARPSIRRRFLGAQTLYHLAVAAVLAVPAAVVLYSIGVRADDYGPRGFIVPWTSIGLSAVVMPLVVAGIIALLFRNGRPAVSRRIS